MRIIISPAKKMRVQDDILEDISIPVFIDEADRIRDKLKSLSQPGLKLLYGANDKITEENYRRLQTMDLRQGLTPAVLAYVGIQYQYMAPDVFEMGQWQYIKDHLYILSGFYGILGACDGVVPYRLEMQAKLSMDGCRDLYGFWGDRLYEELYREAGGVVVNLASKEYSKAIEPYLKPDDRFLTCVFGEEKDQKIKVKATQAKMARGEMVRWMAEKSITKPEKIREFDSMGYRFREEYSGNSVYTFTL